MTRLIFYKANRGQWLDKLVAFLDGGDHSHVERVISETDTHWRTIGSSWRDGGVRLGLIKKSDKWDILDIKDDPVSSGEEYLGYSYDYPGLIHTKISWFPTLPRGLVCSAFIAKIYGLRNPKEFGVRDSFKWAQARCRQ